jgi:hypothetical protein
LRSLGIPHDWDGFYDLSEYRVARILYRQFDSNQDLVAQMCRVHGLQADSLDLLQLRYFLFENNVHIRPDYRPLLFGKWQLPRPASDNQGMSKRRRRFHSQFIPFPHLPAKRSIDEISSLTGEETVRAFARTTAAQLQPLLS